MRILKWVKSRELTEEYSEYFMNEECVSWQWKSAKVHFQVIQRFLILKT